MEDPGLVARFSDPDFTKNFGCGFKEMQHGGEFPPPQKVVRASRPFTTAPEGAFFVCLNFYDRRHVAFP